MTRRGQLIFAADLIEHAFVGVSLSDTIFMGGDLNEPLRLAPFTA